LNGIKGAPTNNQEDKKEHVFITNLDVSMNRMMELVDVGRLKMRDSTLKKVRD